MLILYNNLTFLYEKITLWLFLHIYFLLNNKHFCSKNHIFIFDIKGDRVILLNYNFLKILFNFNFMCLKH